MPCASCSSVYVHQQNLPRKISFCVNRLRVLYALAQPLTTSESEGVYTLADLEGWLHGQADTTEAAIDAVLYQEPPETDVDV
jgi:hypothetical protein